MPRQPKTNRRGAIQLAAVVGAGVALSGLPIPATADPNERYRGYSAEDRAEPYAKYMAAHTAPVLPAVAAAYLGGPTPSEQIPEFSALPADLSPDGVAAVETGYGQTASGAIWVAVHTEMRGVTAAMWDWWFAWHAVESARYKLWHPDAHLYCGLARDRSAERIPDREKYVGNIAYVDEYIGPKLQQLAIAFADPRAHGFRVPDQHTIILGRVGSIVAPVDLGWLAHQVRPIPAGCEMRSRFYLNLHGLHQPDLPQAAHAIARGPAVDPRDLVLDVDLARELLLHCGQEMNHLAGFLPRLYHEFAR
ncbi:DAPG hydrolase family protein [Nocardia fluminea]|uniref:DAPG hydrolase family protein n=1 Tax=Nocardia fluminea TaxID=134984 RepID=UPI00366C4B95